MRSRFWIAALFALAFVVDNAVWAEARTAAVDESGLVAQSPLLTQSGAPQSGPHPSGCCGQKWIRGAGPFQIVRKPMGRPGRYNADRGTIRQL